MTNTNDPNSNNNPKSTEWASIMGGWYWIDCSDEDN